jgi:wobble nucleotide-excising tRNase
MITKIDICNTATFHNALPLEGLKEINFFFGANGTGKTTISRVIADSIQFPNRITWTKAFPLPTLVYNRDFIERNFQSMLKGVFTLGEHEIDTLTKIKATKDEIDKLTDKIKALSITLQGDNGVGGKKKMLSELEELYSERFFRAKQNHDDKLAGGLEGFRGSKKQFKEKVLNEASTSIAALLPLADLESRAATVFSETLMQVQNVAEIQPQKLLSLEFVPILGKRIIGKADVNIAAIIKKLDNSDWVRQGLPYYQANDGVCPFCQQEVIENFSEQLNEYFDETFLQDCAAINTLEADYSTESKRVRQQVEAIIGLRLKFVDNERLESEKTLFDSTVAINLQRLAKKKDEPSQVIELESLQNILDTITVLIASANEKIIAHNTIANNVAHEKAVLTEQIWRFIIEELKNDIADYQKGKSDFIKAIKDLESQLRGKHQELAAKKFDMEELEKQIASIQPTIDAINGLLASFGFKNFSLAKGDDEKTYRLVRDDGSDAQDTLSEGERNFVTFLYFYHLLKGSHTESGMTADKIVVFDDPVSSLDSDVLFIVSSLIQKLFEEVRQKEGTIKQIFVLTHNVYFHKEVAYNSKRNKDTVLCDESFWLVRKNGKESVAERQPSNPVQTSYELLWEEVRSDKRNKATIQNTLRRILESYFKLLGGISLDALYDGLHGDDKIICKTLCSWVHDGSHSAFNDDHYTVLDDTHVARYLDVFRQIFEKSEHLAHYNMMMKQP